MGLINARKVEHIKIVVLCVLHSVTKEKVLIHISHISSSTWTVCASTVQSQR